MNVNDFWVKFYENTIRKNDYLTGLIVLRINYMTHDSVYNLESNIVEKKEWFKS